MWTVWAAVVSSLVLLYVLSWWICEPHRLALKTARFHARELVSVARLVETLDGNNACCHASLMYWWETAASLLKVDARLLRSGDRFDQELAPVKGFPIEDELVSLGELLAEVIERSALAHTIARQSLRLDTFGEYVELLTRLDSSQGIGAPRE